MSANDIELISVSKHYGTYHAVDNVSLSIPSGEFVSILGPSGCGKTTTLSMIAGFDDPTSGEIWIRGQRQTGIPPERRGIGLVFQNYALFPHMTVAENVGFGLKMKGHGKHEIAAAVAAALAGVHLDGFEHRYPKELSGGQQQRVAIARAIAPKPSVLLLDEPLSNLDLKLREAMRIELKEIQEQLGMTFVYVTHDQDEAMAMSDRIVVMSRGVVIQQGRPDEIYDNPKSSFVADFIGKSNLLKVTSITNDAETALVEVDDGRLSLRAPARPAGYPIPAFCCLRPESVRLIRNRDGLSSSTNVMEGTLTRLVNLGAYRDCRVTIANGVVLKSLVRSTRLPDLAVGQSVVLAITPEAVHLLDA